MQDPSFNVNDVAGMKEPDILYEAEVQFDSECKSTTNQDAQKGLQTGMAVAPTCYKCGKVVCIKNCMLCRCAFFRLCAGWPYGF